MIKNVRHNYYCLWQIEKEAIIWNCFPLENDVRDSFKDWRMYDQEESLRHDKKRQKHNP